MATTPYLTSGRILLTFLSISNSLSPYIADWNPTHIHNPRFTPHARFHNGQTMSMGLLLGICTLYYVWRPVLAKSPYTKTMTRDSMFTAAILGTLYWITGLSGALYPGAAWLDDEFLNTKYDAKILGFPGQGPVFLAHACLSWIAYALEVRRLAKLKGE
ncbi:hypothetical protein LTS08_004725 [Lithohypha guttulata]|nr:hypothetical protein LTS08_004725 [Lithohypha guttulata]